MNIRSCLPTSISWRYFFTHILTAMFNISNLALYTNSPDEFLNHYGTINSRLSEGDGLEKFGFGVILLFVVILGYTNQKTFFKRIDRILPNYQEGERDDTDQESLTNREKCDLVLISISAIYKGLVASSSLLALLKTKSTSAGWSIASICLLGNILSQFAILAKKEVTKKLDLHLSYWPRWITVHLLTLTYNLPNTALYFNAADAFLEHIDVLDHRLSKGSDAWEQGLVAMIWIFSAVLLISTQRAYAKEVADVFTNSKENISNEEPQYGQYYHDKCRVGILIETYITSFYKSANNGLSLLSLVYAATNSLVGATLISVCFLGGGFLAQYSIFKPNQHKQSADYEELASEASRPWCCGWFKTGGAKGDVEVSLREAKAVLQYRP